ncbi:MAG: VOC family protein, partial [Actinobacteria bacterium]
MIDAGRHGAVSWVDLSTPDVEAAAAFYGELLGWTIERSMTPMGEYLIGKVGDHEGAGMMVQGPEQRGMP